MKVNIKMKEGCEDLIPAYATKGSAAVDLRAANERILTVSPGDFTLVPTGVHMEIPEGFMLHITPRSGLAAKRGISLVNSPGIIDSDYRGEIGVILINHGEGDFAINRGDRIAQASFVPVMQVEFEKVDDLNETERGAGGFGSTGN